MEGACRAFTLGFDVQLTIKDFIDKLRIRRMLILYKSTFNVIVNGETYFLFLLK